MNKSPQIQISYTPSKLKNRKGKKNTILNFVQKQELPDKIWANISTFQNREIKL